MEINSIQNAIYQKPQLAEKEQAIKNNEKEKDINKKTDNLSPVDEYIKSDNESKKSAGVYSLSKDKNGNTKILYDDPKKQKSKEEQPDQKIKDPNNKEEKCTANTDKVDREIEKLKKEKEKLEQQIKAAAGDEEKVKDLEQKLANVKSQLQQKDNDAYRRQNSSFSNE